MKRALTLGYLLLKRAACLETHRDRFRRYALANKWQNSESLSGPGSTAEYTENLRRELPLVFERFGIRRVLDAPCGDYNWMRLVERPGVEYIGGEVVPELVQANTAAFADKQTRFQVCDIITDDLPAADLWICRDVLFHFSYADIFRTLDNLFRSDITYLLTTDHPEHEVNFDIRTGSFRSMNVMREPFCFPEPILWIDDWIKDYAVRRMGLWHVESLQKALSNDATYQRMAA